MKKTLYVRQDDEETWDKAAKITGGKLSDIIAELLRRFIAEEESKNREKVNEELG